MTDLEKFLEIADVPEMRKDVTNFSNVQWLINNLGIRNKNIDGYSVAFVELKQRYKNFVHSS